MSTKPRALQTVRTQMMPLFHVANQYETICTSGIFRYNTLKIALKSIDCHFAFALRSNHQSIHGLTHVIYDECLSNMNFMKCLRTVNILPLCARNCSFIRLGNVPNVLTMCFFNQTTYRIFFPFCFVLITSSCFHHFPSVLIVADKSQSFC